MISRRDWLRGAGAVGALFPFLRSAQAAPPPPRLVLLMQSNGTNQPAFWPRTPGSLSSPILDPLADLAPKMTVIKGLRNDDGGAGNGHDQGFIGLYSGYRGVGTFDDPWGPGRSLDQELRARIPIDEPFPTLNCGVLASDSPPFKTHRRSFSYSAGRQPIPTEIDPYKLYSRFFPVGAPSGADAVEQRLARKRSVLDYVAGDLAALRPHVPAFERARLDAHQEALRALERRLAATLDPSRSPGCGLVAGPPPGLALTAEDSAPQLIEVMFGFLALALSCRLTRIVTFQFGHGGEKWYFRWLGIDENSHDDIAHRDNGSDPTITAKVVAINTWYAGQVALLARALDQIPEAGGTVLDNTLLVWGNELATGPHGLIDIPIVLLGGAGGRLPRTGLVVDQGPQDYHRLGNSLMRVMGVDAPGFGESPACGPVAGLGV